MILCFSGTGKPVRRKAHFCRRGGRGRLLNALLRGGGAGALFLGAAALRRSLAHARLASACRGGGPVAPRRLGGQPEDVFLPHLRFEPGDAAKYCRRLCTDLGMEYMGLAAAVMPENYLALFPTPDEAEAQER